MSLLRFDIKLPFLSALSLVIVFALQGLCEIYVPLQWTPLNPVFKTSSNTTAYRMNVLPMSKLNIICPNPLLNPVTVQQSQAKDHLFENLWIVDKKSFDSCHVNRSIKSNQLLLKCNEPLKLKNYLLVFLDISPSVQWLEFVRGRDYYFIATSDGTKKSLKNDKNGHCHSHRMKFVIHICQNEQDPHCKKQPATTPTPTTLTTQTIPTTTTSTPTTVTTRPTTIRTTAKPTLTTTTASPVQNDDMIRRNDNNDIKTRTTENINQYTGNMGASKDERTTAQIAEAATWLILVAVMGALLAVSLSCNIYILCCRRVHRRSEVVDDKRSSAAHTLLRDNSRVDRV